MNIKEQETSDYPNYIYHIKVDTRNPNFEECLNVIKTSSNYIDCYQCSSVDCNYAIIRMRMSVVKRVKHLLNSEYSKMYNKTELDTVKKNQYINARYTVINFETNEKTFADSILVLQKDEKALQSLCDKLKIVDEKTIKIMKQNELDSKIKLENEMTNSKLYCNG
jgi:hypothetical protein